MLPVSWRKFLAIVRLILAVSCLALQLIAFNFLMTEMVALFAVYIVYALGAVLWRGLEETRLKLLALAIDFIFFLLAAVAPIAYGHWIAAVFYGYLLISAVVIHNWWKSLGIAAMSVAGVSLAVPLHGSMLLPVLIGGGIVAVALAIERDHLEDRLSQSA